MASEQSSIRHDQNVTDSLSTEFYRQMYTTRRFEETVLDLFAKGVLNGTVQTCIGQEYCSVGVINALNKGTDIVFSNHRGHGHYLALTDDVANIFGQIIIAKEGPGAFIGFIILPLYGIVVTLGTVYTTRFVKKGEKSSKLL